MEEKILNENTLEVAADGVVETVSEGKGANILVKAGIVSVVALAVVGGITTAKRISSKIKNRKAAKAAEQESNSNEEADFNEVEDNDSED